MDINLGNLQSTQGFKIIGESSGDTSGSAVSSAGDFNGDGFDDIIIGASQGVSYHGAGGTGKVYLIFGKATGFNNIDLRILNNSTGFRIIGENSGDRCGAIVSSAGDYNGDGFVDIVIGAYAASGVGKAYVIFGKSNGFSDINLSTLSAPTGFKIIGDNNNDNGWSVSGAGDINKDGYDDIIIGSISKSSGFGLSNVVFGKGIGFSDINLATLSTPNGFKIFGESSATGNGFSVSNAGDLNGDGFADIIVGAVGTFSILSYTGRSYVIFGKNSGFSNIDLSSLSHAQGFRIIGENGGDNCGYSVSSAGDINKDGFSDIIIGSPGYSVSGSGKGYVIFGTNSTFSDINLSTLAMPTGFKIFGENNGDVSSSCVSGVGDFNGDGFNDIIVYSPGASNSTGRGYVIFGKNGTFSNINLSTLAMPTGFKIFGENNGDARATGISSSSGNAVSSAGDINKDGFDDIIISAYNASPLNQASAGISYVIFGSGDPIVSISTASSTNLSTSSNSNLPTTTSSLPGAVMSNAIMNTPTPASGLDSGTIAAIVIPTVVGVLGAAAAIIAAFITKGNCCGKSDNTAGSNIYHGPVTKIYGDISHINGAEGGRVSGGNHLNVATAVLTIISLFTQTSGNPLEGLFEFNEETGDEYDNQEITELHSTQDSINQLDL